MATKKPSDSTPTGRTTAAIPASEPAEPVARKIGRAASAVSRRVAAPEGSVRGTSAQAAAVSVSGEGGVRPTTTPDPMPTGRAGTMSPDSTTSDMPAAALDMPMPAASAAPGGTSALDHSEKMAAAAAPRLSAVAAKLGATDDLVGSLPHNENKPGEHGAAALQPEEGQHAEASDPAVGGSTLSETASSPKVGSGEPVIGDNPNNGPLDRYRADSTGRTLTTNQGVPVADNQNSLKAGLRGPTLLEDFILREKLTHFDHERIPERVVHARGSGAHGYFECYAPLTELTRASIFAEAGKRTPVFVRFSTVAGERGSADTVRDVRGFAVKFYTDEGNWDLVGNNIPVFFIQDAIKFPDMVHAAKPEPHHQMPQAATAHDTFWDFVSLTPESTHMLVWLMSDRAIPRSFRMMQGFGVHTFRMVNAQGQSRFVKFHWKPLAGTHSLVWDEAVKISGADSDFHRRDLWEAIETGNYPEWELGLQVFTEEQAEAFSFDVLDSTKIVPEEIVPVEPIGKMVLDRNPDNFFAETEQVAFCTAHIVPGLDFTNDPLLAGRIHSYVDTQLLRLGGPNFHEIPINAPVAQVHNNQRDGLHRATINRGRVNYEPNSLAGGCPFQAGVRGFTSFPRTESGDRPGASAGSGAAAAIGAAGAAATGVGVDKVRGKPERFADHYTQARLFFRSQTAVEQSHIVGAFRFELSRVQTPAVRERVLAMLANVDATLAGRVAEGLGMDVPEPLPLALAEPVTPEVEQSAALSLFARPGDGTIRGRRVAILAADGVDTGPLAAVRDALLAAGAAPRLVGTRFGRVSPASGDPLVIDTTIETMPSQLFDAMVVPGGEAGVQALTRQGQAIEFVQNQYRHCKSILVIGAGTALMQAAGVPPTLPDGSADPGLVVAGDGDGKTAVEAFAAAIARHRHYERDADPPAV